MSRTEVVTPEDSASEAEMIAADLLDDGWQRDLPGELGLLDAVELLCKDSARRIAGPRQAPDSKPPYRGSVVGLGIDVHNGTRRLHRRACEEAFGHERAHLKVQGSRKERYDGGRAVTRAALRHLVVLLPKVSDDLAEEILKQFRTWRFRAELGLEEVRPDRLVPLVCPRCDDEGVEHRLLLRVLDFSGWFVRCTACESQWDNDDLGWFSTMQNWYADQPA